MGYSFVELFLFYGFLLVSLSSVDRNSHALNFHCESEESYGEMNSNVSCHCQMSMVNKAPSLEVIRFSS